MESHSTDDNSNGTALERAPRSGQVARQDFSGRSLAQAGPTDALVAKARADVEARWIIAQRCRRSLDDVRQELLLECRRPSFARVAMYARPVGKKQDANGLWVNALAEGLSIRFAEAAARCMGNLQPDVQTIYDGPDSRIVRCTVTDYETNVTWSRDLNVSKSVERKQLKKGQRPIGERVNSFGDRVFIVDATDDETNVKEAAMVSKAVRTLILRVVPGHIQDECKSVIKQIAAQADAQDPAGARNRCFDAFGSIGVRPTEIAKYLGHTLDTISPAELEELRSVYVAIRDGETSWAEALADALEAPPATPTQAPQAATTTAPPPAQPDAAKPQPAPNGEATAPAKPKKGAAALKADLKGSTPAAKEAPPPADPREAEPEWMSGKAEPEQAPQPAVVTPSAAPPPGMEERTCASCKVPIDVPIESPPGQKCYTCQMS